MTKEAEFADTISRFLNHSHRQNDEVIDKLISDHPTIQQNTMRFCIQYIERMAKKERCIDGRNEASVKLAQQIVNAVPDRHLPYI